MTQSIIDGYIKGDDEFYDRFGFHKDAFTQYLAESFSGFEIALLREIVNNVIDYACMKENSSKDQAVSFILDILPVSFMEVAAFASDDILTDDSIRAKHYDLQEEKQ